MSTIMYARVSSDMQEEGCTIRSQVDAVLHHSSLWGEAPDEIYADDGVSGYTKALWLRPEGARLIQDAERGRWRGYELVVLPPQPSRPAGQRDRGGDRPTLGLWCHGVQRQGRLPVRQSNPNGKFTRQLFASLAELDRNTIVETTRDGLV